MKQEYSLDNFYLQLEEPEKGCFLGLKQIILSLDKDIENVYKYGGSFFTYKNKSFCYLWQDKKTGEPYIGVIKGIKIESPHLESGNRKMIKILRINPNEDFPIEIIKSVLNQALNLY